MSYFVIYEAYFTVFNQKNAGLKQQYKGVASIRLLSENHYQGAGGGRHSLPLIEDVVSAKECPLDLVHLAANAANKGQME